METNYKKVALAVAAGTLAASAVKLAIGATTTAVTGWWIKRKFKKEFEAQLD